MYCLHLQGDWIWFGWMLKWLRGRDYIDYVGGLQGFWPIRAVERRSRDRCCIQSEFLTFVDMKMATCLTADSGANLRGTRSVLLSLFQSSDWLRSLQPWCVSNEVSPPDHLASPWTKFICPENGGSMFLGIWCSWDHASLMYSFKYNQQDATLYSILYYCQCATCFWRFLHLSSGAQKLYTQHRVYAKPACCYL